MQYKYLKLLIFLVTGAIGLLSLAQILLGQLRVEVSLGDLGDALPDVLLPGYQQIVIRLDQASDALEKAVPRGILVQPDRRLFNYRRWKKEYYRLNEPAERVKHLERFNKVAVSWVQKPDCEDIVLLGLHIVEDPLTNSSYLQDEGELDHYHVWPQELWTASVGSAQYDGIVEYIRGPKIGDHFYAFTSDHSVIPWQTSRIYRFFNDVPWFIDSNLVVMSTTPHWITMHEFFHAFQLFTLFEVGSCELYAAINVAAADIRIDGVPVIHALQEFEAFIEDIRIEPPYTKDRLQGSLHAYQNNHGRHLHNFRAWTKGAKSNTDVHQKLMDGFADVEWHCDDASEYLEGLIENIDFLAVRDQLAEIARFYSSNLAADPSTKEWVDFYFATRDLQDHGRHQVHLKALAEQKGLDGVKGLPVSGR